MLCHSNHFLTTTSLYLMLLDGFIKCSSGYGHHPSTTSIPGIFACLSTSLFVNLSYHLMLKTQHSTHYVNVSDPMQGH